MDLVSEVIVIGAGQAGLTTSYYLKKEGIKHIVLEQKVIGYSWISQRWDSFKMNTPNWMTWLPGMELSEEIREHFMTKNEFVAYLKKYAGTFQFPVKEGYKVVRLQRENNRYIITAENNDQQIQWQAKVVIIAPNSELRTPNSLLIFIIFYSVTSAYFCP